MEYRIIRIPILPFNMVNAYLICNESGCILLDTGVPGSEQKIAKGLRKAGYDFRDIKLIVVTHAHVDHAGAAGPMRKLSKAPVVGHANDLKYFRGEAQITYCPTGLAGRLFYRTPLPHEKYETFSPELLLQEGDEYPLSAFGFDGRILHTPGHTAGSISLEINQKAFVGDMAASGILIGGILCNRRPIQPPFEDDARTVIASLQQMLRQGNEEFYLGHGGPLSSDQIRKHISHLERKLAKEQGATG